MGPNIPGQVQHRIVDQPGRPSVQGSHLETLQHRHLRPNQDMLLMTPRPSCNPQRGIKRMITQRPPKRRGRNTVYISPAIPGCPKLLFSHSHHHGPQAHISSISSTGRSRDAHSHLLFQQLRLNCQDRHRRPNPHGVFALQHALSRTRPHHTLRIWPEMLRPP